MANSAVYLDVNIAISKYRFNSAAFFEIVMFGPRKRFLLRVFIFQRILFMFKTGSQLLSFNRFSTLIYICIFSFPDIAEFCNLHDCHKQLCKVFTSDNGTV